jgi:hypothetical protein
VATKTQKYGWQVLHDLRDCNNREQHHVAIPLSESTYNVLQFMRADRLFDVFCDFGELLLDKRLVHRCLADNKVTILFTLFAHFGLSFLGKVT